MMGWVMCPAVRSQRAGRGRAGASTRAAPGQAHHAGTLGTLSPFAHPTDLIDRAAMPKSAIATARAPAAIGPYAQAIKAGNTGYLAGQIGLDPASGQLVEGIDAMLVLD